MLGPLPYANIFKHGPCPHCGEHVRPEDRQCAHCNRELSDVDRQRVLEYANAQHRKGIRVGLFLFSALVVAAVAYGLMVA